MLPGLSTVLRRDKERQRSTQNGSNEGSPMQTPSSPPTVPLRRDDSAGSSGYAVSSPTQAMPMRRPMLPAQQQFGAAAAAIDSPLPTPPAPQGGRPQGLLPEEHRARERERERLARAQLGNAHTTQLMANRQMQKNIQTTAGHGNGASPSDGNAQTRYSSSHMESSVTRLLVATKMLLEALTKWSLGQRTETQVSDIYVRLGNDFNVANVAFGSYGIDMSDLANVPDDLRECLERCLSEDASPQTLEVHLPRIREIIIGLLQGLKGKQAEYKQLLIQRRASARSSKSKAMMSDVQGIDTPPSVSHVGEMSPNTTLQNLSVKGGGPSSLQNSFEEDVRRSVAGRRPMHAPPLVESTAPQRPLSSNSTRKKGRRDTSDSQRPEADDSSSIGKTNSPAIGDLSLPEIGSQEAALGLVSGEPEKKLARSQTMGALDQPPSDSAIGEIGDAADPSVRALKSRDALERRASKRFSAYTFNKMGVGLNQSLGMSFTNSAMSSPVVDRTAGGTPSKGSVRRGLGRSSSELNSIETPTKGKDRGIAGETIPETDPPLRKKGSKTSPRPSPKGPSLSLAPPPLPTMKENLNSSTESLPFVDAHSPTKTIPELDSDDSLPKAESIPPVPPLPSRQQQAKLDAVHSKQSNNRWGGGARTPTATTPHMSSQRLAPTSISLFLQLGRQTKKAVVDLDPTAPFSGLSTGKLRMLFMDKFSYSPGKEDFPSIYVKDSQSGVTYEMEDLTEIGDGTVLTLNIEPLDQVKQHLDLTLGGITRELRDIKSVMQDRDRMWSRRLSSIPADGLAPPLSPHSRISDAQFQMAGARVAQYKRATMFFGQEQPESAEKDDEVVDQKESKDDDSAARPKSVGWQFAGNQLKKQYEEVLNVRRQLAIMAQLQDDFKSDVGGILGGLREQAKRVRAIAATEVPTERNFIISGKARLDSNSQEILTLVEDLLDSVDDLKADVIQRGVKPKPHTMKKLGDDIDRATRGLDDLTKYVDLVKPSWKKTWEIELQNIVDEQEFLNHQEGLISDLKEDHANLQDVFHNIQEVIKLRGANKFNLTGGGVAGGSENALSNISLRTYIPPPPEEGHEGLSTVMMEVKSQSVDHEKRLKALQAAEKQRLKELNQRKQQEDDFQNELTTFVDGKALRRTGGYQETERVRGRRDKLTLQAMFGGGGAGGAPAESTAPAPKKLVLGGSGAGSSSGDSQSGEQQVSSTTSIEGTALDDSSGLVVDEEEG